MALVYVIQVMAHHGYGLEGWRTVRNSAGEPYRFTTQEAAQAALQRYFSNLREGLNVRIHSLEATDVHPLMPMIRTEPPSRS